MKQAKRIVVRTVVGLGASEVEHHQDELVLNLSPEQYSMFRKRAQAAGKTVEDYLMQDTIGLPTTAAAAPIDLPVPFAIVEETPASKTDAFLATVVAALYPAKRRKKELARIQKTVVHLRMPFDVMLRCALGRVLEEVETTGRLSLEPYIRPIVSFKMRKRLAEIDRVFGFEGEHRFTEWAMEQIVKDLRDGEDGLLFDGYNFDDPAQAFQNYMAMAQRWRTEDGLEPVAFMESRIQKFAATEGRAAA